jgi:hypothetical protein
MKKLFTILLFLPVLSLAANLSDFAGRWEIAPGKNLDTGRRGGHVLEIQTTGNQIALIRSISGRSTYADTLALTVGQTIEKEITTYRIPNIFYLGIRGKKGDKKTFATRFDAATATMTVVEKFPVLVSQGNEAMTQVHTYTLKPDEIMVYRLTRPSRQGGDEQLITYKPENSKKAWTMELENEWNIDGKLDQNAALISLQGVVNRSQPQLYFVYPEKWDFNFTPHVREFLQTKRYYTFLPLQTLEQAVETFRKHIKGYIVWDKEVRTSLIVAFTLAGLEDAVVVSGEQIPLMEKNGIPCIEDYRGKFSGQNDFQIYSWAKAQYWSRSSKESIVWLGGEHGRIMKPGVVDWGMYNRAFFQDLSCHPADSAEYNLAKELLSEMKPMSRVYGWHSYKKDSEGEYTTLASSFGYPVDGLHSLPNMSFMKHVPVTPGFTFKNNHNIEPGKTYKPEKKVYIACIQTDCLGLGAWTQPGRGTIPYAWEVTMNWSWMAPAMLEFFYSQATPNDYFIGSLGGPGYMYPRAIPKDKLPALVDKAYSLMQDLDLNYFEIMDHARLGQKESNNNLPLDIIQTFFERMPGAIGFGNGYNASHTFYSDGKRSLISFDYYLAQDRSETDAVADLNELIFLNKDRPYFLLMHVRQWSNIERVKSILDKLGPEVEVVPLDLFTMMANAKPTFKNWYLPSASAE